MSSNIGLYTAAGGGSSGRSPRDLDVPSLGAPYYAPPPAPQPAVMGGPDAPVAFRQRYPSPTSFEPASLYVRHSPRSPNNKPAGNYEQFAAFGLNIVNAVAERLLVYPCVAIRRQCQVNSGARQYHLTPFTLLPVVYNLQNEQGPGALWKGVTSVNLVLGIRWGVENALCDLGGFPKEVNANSSAHKVGRHLLMKTISIVVASPFTVAAAFDSVQSTRACEPRAGLLDCVWAGAARLGADIRSLCWPNGGLDAVQSARRVPLWTLLPPTIAHGLAHYVLAGATHHLMYSVVRKYVSRKPRQARTGFDEFYPELFATFASHLAADALLYPLETVLHRLYMQGTRAIIDNLDNGVEVAPVAFKYNGVLSCFRHILDEEGWTGLYKGVGALLLQYLLHFMLLRGLRIVHEAFEEAQLQQAAATASSGTDTPPMAVERKPHF